MAKVNFTFEDSDEEMDVLICTHRWDCYDAIQELFDLVRQLYNGKTYREKYLYPVTEIDEETNEKVITGYVLEGEEDEIEPVEFIEVNYIADRLADITKNLGFVLYQ